MEAFCTCGRCLMLQCCNVAMLHFWKRETRHTSETRMNKGDTRDFTILNSQKPIS